MSEAFNAVTYDLSLKISDGTLERVTKAMDEVPYHYAHVAGVFDLLAEGIRGDFLREDDGRVAALCELLGCGMRWLADTEGEEVGGFANTLRLAQKGAPVEFVKPQKQGAKP